VRTIVLWDIDNTLLYAGGAGSLGARFTICTACYSYGLTAHRY
jgi:hypothetical protein